MPPEHVKRQATTLELLVDEILPRPTQHEDLRYYLYRHLLHLEADDIHPPLPYVNVALCVSALAQVLTFGAKESIKDFVGI